MKERSSSNRDHRRQRLVSDGGRATIRPSSKIETPFGAPSDALIGGKMHGRQVYFLPRHGRGHRFLPHELNHRANIYALRSLNVRWIICVTAVGSLQEKYAPRDVLLPSQFYDRTSQRADSHLLRRRDRRAHRLRRADQHATCATILRGSRRGRSASRFTTAALT